MYSANLPKDFETIIKVYVFEINIIFNQNNEN